MNSTLQITFRGLPQSDALETRIREKAEKLERHYGRITSCHVVVDSPHKHQHKGSPYNVRIDLAVPGAELVINRDPSGKDEHTDVYIAVRDAFKAAERQLENYAAIRRGNVKHHD